VFKKGNEIDREVRGGVILSTGLSQDMISFVLPQLFPVGRAF